MGNEILNEAENYTIRRISGGEEDDIFQQLSELDKICIGAEGWSAESFRSEAAKENGIVLACFKGERLAGLLAGYTAAGEGDITTAAVSPEYRRQGIAYRLMQEFFSLLPEDSAEVFLEVRESNIPAIELYKKCGFKQVGLRKRFYSQPEESAVVMKAEKNNCGDIK